MLLTRRSSSQSSKGSSPWELTAAQARLTTSTSSRDIAHAVSRGGASHAKGAPAPPADHRDSRRWSSRMRSRKAGFKYRRLIPGTSKQALAACQGSWKVRRSAIHEPEGLAMSTEYDV